MSTRHNTKGFPEGILGLFAFLGVVLLTIGVVAFAMIYRNWNPYGSNASPALLANQTFQLIATFFVAWLGTVMVSWSYRFAESE